MKHLIGTLYLILISTSTALAYLCVKESMPKAYESAGAVFAGKVVGVKPTASEVKGDLPGQQVTMEVTRSWKLVSDAEVTLKSGNPCGGCCGYYFQRGESYLVFASVARDGTLYTSKCTQTSKYSEAGEHLKVIGEGTLVEPRSAVMRHLNGVFYTFIASVFFLCGVAFFFWRNNRGAG